MPQLLISSTGSKSSAISNSNKLLSNAEEEADIVTSIVSVFVLSVALTSTLLPDIRLIIALEPTVVPSSLIETIDSGLLYIIIVNHLPHYLLFLIV